MKAIIRKGEEFAIEEVMAVEEYIKLKYSDVTIGELHRSAQGRKAAARKEKRLEEFFEDNLNKFHPVSLGRETDAGKSAVSLFHANGYGDRARRAILKSLAHVALERGDPLLAEYVRQEVW